MAIKYSEGATLLDAVLGRRSKLGALRCLFREGEALAGREVARRTGLSHPAVHKALGELSAQGIVRRRSVPPTYLFTPNPTHWICSEILGPMFSKEAAWLSRLELLLSHGAPASVVSLVLFGSIVKGSLTPRSDIDLLALVASPGDMSAVETHFHGIARRAYQSYGRPLSTIVLPAAEYAARYDRKDGFAKDVAYRGRVIRGRLLTEVLFERGAKEHRR